MTILKIKPVAIERDEDRPFNFPGMAHHRVIANSTHYIIEPEHGIIFVDYLEIGLGCTLELMGDAAIEVT